MSQHRNIFCPCRFTVGASIRFYPDHFTFSLGANGKCDIRMTAIRNNGHTISCQHRRTATYRNCTISNRDHSERKFPTIVHIGHTRRVIYLDIRVTPVIVREMIPLFKSTHHIDRRCGLDGSYLCRHILHLYRRGLPCFCANRGGNVGEGRFLNQQIINNR